MEQNKVENTIEKKELNSQDSKIKLHASSVALTVGFVVSLAALILEIIFSNTTMVYGFICLGMCFLISGVEKWLAYFSFKNKNDLYNGIADAACVLACISFVVLALV